MHLVKRTCTEVPKNETSDPTQARPQPLSAYQQLSVYVLLGDPGAGKTTIFEHEADRLDASYVTARDLITFEDRPEWHDKILFVDGLDEIRAGSLDARTPFDAIRTRLEKLGRPHFRLSCREADWFGATDQSSLKSVSPDGQVTILHLDPLTDANITEILTHNPRVPNADEFIQRANQRGLNELLINPQILDMLAQAVADGNWPDSRKQTFELACKTIIREHNQEHIVATRIKPVNENQQLNAAGFLCAVQLIAGKSGYALTRNMATNEFPYLGDTSHEEIELLFEVARTKLFKTPIEGQITPVHRHVAEYLAAWYLAHRIDHDGLPIARILALITGEDGVVVSELRGLSAWLAALCMKQRSVIIDRDPLGVVLYGDVQDFNPQDKRHVLDGLQREAARYPWFRLAHWTASPFGALATPDMAEEFLNILSQPDRSEKHQALVTCILDAISHGTRYPSLDDLLIGIVRDASWGARVRQQALKALPHSSKIDPNTVDRLTPLLSDINNGTVTDPEDYLMSYLLTKLYPRTVPATEVLDYLHMPKRKNHFGSYFSFWAGELLKLSSDTDIHVLLDELTTRLDNLQPIINDLYLVHFTVELLERGLGLYGESISSEHLYKWLGVALHKYANPIPSTKTQFDNIRSWLETHPERQKSIIGIGLNRCVEKENFGYCMSQVRARLFQADPPTDFGQWCLEQLEIASNEQVARYLLQEAVLAIWDQRGNAELTLELIQHIVGKNQQYIAWLNEMLVCRIEPKKQEHAEKRRQWKSEQYRKKQEWLRYAKSHELELREGCAPISLLYELARAYFGQFIDSKGDTPLERLRMFLNNDNSLVQSVIEGLRLTLARDDIPDIEEIIQLYTKNKTSLLDFPFLAGVKEFTQSSPENVTQLSDDQIRKAIAFYFINSIVENPDWYKSLLVSRPGLVADGMIAYVGASIRSKLILTKELNALAYSDEYSQVARLTALPLLKTFPIRSTLQQIAYLDELLKTALRYIDREELLVLIREKLNHSSMNDAQRVRWLSTGMIIAPKEYKEPLADFTHSHEKRIQHLAGFLADRSDQWLPLNELPTASLGLLVRSIGKFFAPYMLEGTGLVSPAMNAADFVNRLINRLGSQPEKEATNILDDLSKDSGLRRWHTALQRALFEQRAARREASFRHPNIRQVSETLHNRSPANAGDLAALTMDILQELANQIKNGNTNDYRQFWNEGSQRQLDTPKHEDTCRDTLLSDMQQRLAPLGIDAQPEGRYADDKRADIRVSYGGTAGFEVPIEIKKNTHQKLWHAIHDQLIQKYTRDPRAHGYGIYLVFWFGTDKTQAPPSGTRPRTADELKERLRATLSADEGRKISVCVIDVSKPV